VAAMSRSPPGSTPSTASAAGSRSFGPIEDANAQEAIGEMIAAYTEFDGGV
jgi:hypothetical protein